MDTLFNMEPLPEDSPFRRWQGGTEVQFMDFIHAVRSNLTSVMYEGRLESRAEAQALQPQWVHPTWLMPPQGQVQAHGQ